ncbi:cytochrome b/b6 domain-containing protein [Pontibacter sp. G13]|uniref:cytochrome b/b6 domain-containing protein n=1 Tax=Pontibacter sp. G13 TaxID=3074898 RepID=UPI002889E087|nr:cytochrome b/b6 domain-containing protein [Pontibacter sp. G13]WNJ17109.1 cytochrome b/b6 domain-containing protein [Pontibacter sp. G13]
MQDIPQTTEQTSAPSTYSKRTVWIHWVSALLIFGLIYTGINMEHGEHAPAKFDLYRIHFGMGVIVFVLTIIRTLALFRDPRPAHLYRPGSFHQRFIAFVHRGFYVVILWMCVSGIASLFLEGIMPAILSGQFADLPEIGLDGFHPIMLSHHIVAKFVFLLLIFHLVGFVMHLIRKQENTLPRVWSK